MQELVRKNIRALQPYSCARDEFRGREAHVFVDANESPFNTGYNRYPDPLQEEIKSLLAPIKNVHPDEIFLGNGSDEAIDLVYRVFCEPRVDNVVAMAPSYGMYEVCANINDVEYRKVLLDENFRLHADAMLSAADDHTKVMWICSPNNPTGNDMDRKEVKRLLDEFPGILVVDEAYIDFSSLRSLRELVRLYPRLIVLNTFSKAWASASVRLGIAFAQSEIIALFNKVKYPYNINLLTQQYALELLRNGEKVQRWTNDVKREREIVVPALKEVRCVVKVYPTDANFVLVKVTDAVRIYNYLVDRGIVVRNRNNVQLCGNCLRITIGSKEENNEVLGALRSF
ncbi:MAG: histidinol-phosphate transaminase [Bacteroidaceae bacterium]|jgi:histidinol-phosphate aminotransferase|nr:histidinol-phosphate transaminase [Bacteroidaceae bacterium]